MKNFNPLLISRLGGSPRKYEKFSLLPQELQKRGIQFELQDYEFRTPSTFAAPTGTVLRSQLTISNEKQLCYPSTVCANEGV